MANAKPQKLSPAEVARETFRQLSLSRTQPTPDAYQKVYNDIAGVAAQVIEPRAADGVQQELESILTDFAATLVRENKDYAAIGQHLSNCARMHNWNDYQKGLNSFIEKIFVQINTLQSRATDDVKSLLRDSDANNQKQESVLKDLLTRTLGLALPSLLSTAPELSAESDALSQLLKNATTDREMLDIGARLKNLCFRIEHIPVADPIAKAESVSMVDDPIIPMLSRLLAQTLNLAVSALLQHDPKLMESSDQLALQVKNAKALSDFHSIESQIKDLCYKITLKGDDTSEQLQLLLSLFKLLLENVSSLLDDDNWLRGQVIVIKDLITGQIDHRALLDATKSLKQVIYKQGMLKDSIARNKLSVKQLMSLFVDRLAVFADNTGQYHDKITSYSSKITHDTSAEEINQVIDQILADTLQVQGQAKQSYDMMLSAQKEVSEAENRVAALEKKLAEMSNQVHKDQLTGSLNRRGLDELLEREGSRADRRKTPLSFGMLDVDNFKKINDTYGHTTGDDALIHLVSVIKKTLRSMDVVARYGGEEFAIIMPETALKDAADTMMRVQRELTKHFFMAGEERLLITFSAGVAERHPTEDQQTLIVRADKAMYKAKTTGKNRVITAH